MGGQRYEKIYTTAAASASTSKSKYDPPTMKFARYIGFYVFIHSIL